MVILARNANLFQPPFHPIKQRIGGAQSTQKAQFVATPTITKLVMMELLSFTVIVMYDSV